MGVLHNAENAMTRLHPNLTAAVVLCACVLVQACGNRTSRQLEEHHGDISLRCLQPESLTIAGNVIRFLWREEDESGDASGGGLAIRVRDSTPVVGVHVDDEHGIRPLLDIGWAAPDTLSFGLAEPPRPEGTVDTIRFNGRMNCDSAWGTWRGPYGTGFERIPRAKTGDSVWFSGRP